MIDKAEARETVIRAGKKLLDTGLIARTWGNVSCRINEAQFVITPSGRPYETLAPGEIVPVNIRDCTYEGDVEPSSEKGVHAEVYRQRPDINFIIHTHQPYASAVSPLKTDIHVEDPSARTLIGGKVISISYGLPGSKKLRRNVASAISRSGGRAYLMVSHGALCLGRDSDEAFRVAASLEHACIDFINGRYLELSGKNHVDPAEIRKYFLEMQTGNQSNECEIAHNKYFNSERNGRGFKIYLDASEKAPFSQYSGRVIEIPLGEDSATGDESRLPAGAEIHREIYRKYADVRAVIHTAAPDILAVSCTGKPVYPLLDDFAQIIGPGARTADPAAVEESGRRVLEISRKIKGRGAVLIKGSGALCCGPSRDDAAAAAAVLDKNCKAVIAATLFGQGKPINVLECMLMRYNYLKRYSKKAYAKAELPSIS